MLKSSIVIIFITLFSNGMNAQVSVERNLNLELAEKNSVTSSKIEKALNGFLTEAQERDYSEKYVDSTHLLKYDFFFSKK